MRVHPLASLLWLLALAVWCLVPLHDAWSAKLAWSTTPAGERLVFKFDSTLPPGTPRQVTETAILLPIKWSYWRRERKPRMTASIPDTALLRAVEFSQKGMTLKFDGPVAFTASTKAARKTLVIDIQNLELAKHNATPATVDASRGDKSTAPTTDRDDTAQVDVANATAPVPDPAVGATTDRMPAASVSLRVGPGQVVRNRIMRPGQDLNSTIGVLTASPPSMILAPGESWRRPVARVLPEELRALNATATTPVATGNSPVDSGVVVEPVAVVPMAGRDTNASGKTGAANSTEITSPDHAGISGPSATAGNATNASLVTVPDLGGNATNASLDENATVAQLQDQLALAQQSLADGRLAAAREILQGMLRQQDVPDDLREELLFMVADILMQEGRSDLSANFSKILAAYEAAKNYDPPSERLPEALANIGYLHLAVGNVPEARGYFDYLRRRFPEDPRVPMIDYYWGEHYAAQGAVQKAADHFQYVLQNHPKSAAAEPSAVGLLKCLGDLGYADKAYESARRIEKQWPGVHLRYPGFLMAAGNAALATGDLDKARDYFWTYYNVYPQSFDADMALVRIGDIFVKTGQHGAARDTFHKAAQEYPDKEGGLIAQMRLAEEGLLAPTADFVGPLPRRPALDPEAVYGRILENPDGSLAPVARLKLAMWYLWNKRYEAALREAARFAADYPDHDLSDKNGAVQGRAIREWILASHAAGDFPTVLRAWDEHGHLLENGGLEPGVRLAVATAMLENDQTDRGLDMAKPLILAKPRNGFSEPALDLVLSNLVGLKRWRDVIDVVREASAWNLPPDRQRELDYAAGLAHENLDEHRDSQKFWAKLATDMGVPDAQRSYALYFLARQAMSSGDVERAGILAQDALNLLVKEKTDIPKIKDCLDMLIRAAEASGRDQDALSWVLQYDEYIPEADPGWPAFAYRKALLYKKLGDRDKWREIATDLIAKKPDTLYSRMAASELEAQRLEQETQRFR